MSLSPTDNFESDPLLCNIINLMCQALIYIHSYLHKRIHAYQGYNRVQTISGFRAALNLKVGGAKMCELTVYFEFNSLMRN